MTAEEALALLDRQFPNVALSNLQESVFCQVWEGKTYAEIADTYCYEYSYIRDVGYKLWQTLSAVTGQKISKSNIKAVLGRYSRTGVDAGTASCRSRVPPQINPMPMDLEFPNGPVPLSSKLYIDRPPIETQPLLRC